LFAARIRVRTRSRMQLYVIRTNHITRAR